MIEPSCATASPQRETAGPRRNGGIPRGCLQRLRGRTALLAMALLAAALPVRSGQLRGLAALSQPFPLPAGAVLDVQLIEPGGSNASTSVLRGRSRTPVSGMAPFAFTVAYLDAAIRPAGRYRLRATIHQADRLLFRAAEVAAPGFADPAVPVRLLLEPVGDAPLRGLLWLRAPAASLPAPATAPRQEQQFRLDPLSRELTGSGDCNRFIGRFELAGDSLRLEPQGATLLECEPEVTADEARFIADLLQVRRWRLDDLGRLQLLDQNGTLLLLMETRPL